MPVGEPTPWLSAVILTNGSPSAAVLLVKDRSDGTGGPLLDGPDLIWWSSVVGPIAAPTEQPDQFVNATPIIVACVTAAVAIKMR